MRLILLGPPGAGKGTFAVKMSAEYGVPHISTGDLLRQAVKDETAAGLKAKAYMEKGDLVTDEIVIEMVKDRLALADCSKGFLLDGFPRNIKQADMLKICLADLSTDIDRVIYLDTKEDILVSRLTGRRTCRACGANYHIVNIPPKQDGICDKCGGELYQRADDNEKTILNRLEVYNKETASLIDYYEQEQKLARLDGARHRDTVYDEIVNLLK